jgi:hypothetical protein
MSPGRRPGKLIYTAIAWLDERRTGGGLLVEHGPEDGDDRGQVAVGGRPHQQARRDRVRSAGRPRLPGADHCIADGPGPHQVETRGVRGRDRPQHQLRHRRKLAATRSPQPPEQVLEAVLVAVDDPPVGEHRAHGDELVGGQAVRAAEDAEAAAQGQAGDPDPWPATRSDRAIVGSERVVDVGKAPRRRR